MLQELTVAVRSVSQRRGMAAAVVLTLALAIGMTAVVFAAIDAILFRPLDYPASDRLVSVHEVSVGQQSENLVAPVKLEEWNRLNRSFAGLAGSYLENVTDTTGHTPERVAAMRVSPRFFAVLGTPAALGRTTTDDEETFGGPAIVVLSDAFWHTRFNGDRSVIGQSLMLGGLSRTIIGVMPSSFRYPTPDTDVWIPAQISPRLMTMREARRLHVTGRLAPAVPVELAQSDLRAIQQRLGMQYPRTDRGWTVTVSPLKEQQVRGVRNALWVLFAAVIVLLLVACVNIACVLLADGARREQEIAVRFAIGAHRSQVVRQLLFEGLALALTGSLLGLLLAGWGLQGLRVLATGLPRATEITANWRLVAFTLIVGLMTTLLFASLPAWRVTGSGAERMARGGRARIGGHQRLQRGLVAAQVMSALVLLVGGGLLVRSLLHLQDRDPGFDPSEVLTFRMSAAWNERPEEVANRQLRTLQRLRDVPGIASAALSSFRPGGSNFPPTELEVVDRIAVEPQFATALQVSADYFSTLRAPMLQGESCGDALPVEPTPKVVINHTFAERFFGQDDPVGKQIVMGRTGEIVGVAADVREAGLLNEPAATAYYCGLMPFQPDPYYIVRRSSSQPVTATTIREALREIEPGRSVFDMATLNETLSDSLSQQRLSAILLGLFAVMTAMLAAIGLYGMLAQFVSQRRREIGVRIALGAQPAHVLAGVLKQAAWVTGIGLLLGLVLAFALSRVMTTLLFGISSQDPVTFMLVPLLLAVVAAFAALIPGIRAVRLDPVTMLRDE